MTHAPAHDPRKSLSAAGPDADHSARVMHSYLVGVYLAVNAIRDSYLVVEGPDCAHMKTQFVQGSHDWLSTLTSVSGFHRVTNTALHPVQMARSRESGLQQVLNRIAAHEKTSGILLSSMPMAFITGADYDRICKETAEAFGKSVVHVPGKSLSGDWLDGYGEALLALAKRIPLPPSGKLEPSNVAIVGYLFDRNEADHHANVTHLRDLLSRVGLHCVSVWLEGQSFGQLADVASAGTILSFPYARKAARMIASRTGARLIECELPFGLDASERWLEGIGKALGVERRAKEVIEEELSRVVPSLEWVIPFQFQGRSVAYVGDPHMAIGVKEISAMLGAELRAAVVTNPPSHCVGLEEKLRPARLQVWPKQHAFRAFMQDAMESDHISLLVANHHGVGIGKVAWLEIGFPCMYRHALYDRPFLGFRGLLSFVDLLANAARTHDVYQALDSPARRRGPGSDG